jgi:transposase
VLNVPDNAAVYLWTKAMDMRCGFDRLAVLVKDQIGKQVAAGGVYVFLSRSRDRVKLLWWDEDGYALFYKRLEAGTFKVEWRDGCEELTGVDLKLLLSGMDLQRIYFRKKVENGLYNAA